MLAYEHRRVVRFAALRIGLEPVAGFRRRHFVIVGREQADRRGPSDATGEHCHRDVHHDVVHFDRPQRATWHLFENALDRDQGFLEGQVSRRATTRGTQWYAARANLTEVEFNFGAVQVAHQQRVECIRPPFQRVWHRVMHDRHFVFGGAQREARQLCDVMSLHTESDPRSRKQQEKGFLERVQSIHVREGAVEHARVVRFDGRAAKLQ